MPFDNHLELLTAHTHAIRLCSSRSDITRLRRDANRLTAGHNFVLSFQTSTHPSSQDRPSSFPSISTVMLFLYHVPELSSNHPWSSPSPVPFITHIRWLNSSADSAASVADSPIILLDSISAPPIPTSSRMTLVAPSSSMRLADSLPRTYGTSALPLASHSFLPDEISRLSSENAGYIGATLGHSFPP